MASQRCVGDFLAKHRSSELFRGFRLAHFAAKEDEPSIATISIVTVRSLDGISCDPSLFDDREFSRWPYDRFRVREGDVLVGLASPYRVACVDGYVQEAVVSASVAVLRIDGEARRELDPWFVAGYLNLPDIAATLLPSKASGRNLTLDDIRAVTLPKLDIEAQRALGDAARALGFVQLQRRMVGTMEMASLTDQYAKLAASMEDEG